MTEQEFARQAWERMSGRERLCLNPDECVIPRELANRLVKHRDSAPVLLLARGLAFGLHLATDLLQCEPTALIEMVFLPLDDEETAEGTAEGFANTYAPLAPFASVWQLDAPDFTAACFVLSRAYRWAIQQELIVA